MKKMLSIAVVLLISVSAYAQKDISVGVYGGLNIPIVQEDVKSGSEFGLKAKFSPIPMIGFSAFFESRKFGDPEIDVAGITQKSDGGDVSSFGAEVLIGNVGGEVGLHFYWALGISSYKWSRNNWEDLTEVGYHVGPGIEIILPVNIGVELKGKFEIVPTDGDGSRKNALVQVGANYHFGIM